MAKRTRRRRSKRERRRRWRWLSLALALLAALAYLWIGPWLRERVGIVGPGPGPRANALRIVSWNLANFEGEASGHDLARIREVLDELDPDVLALQEIRDLDALAELLPEFELLGSDQGGRSGQRLVIAWRPERVELLASAEHPELSLDGRVRPGLAGYLRGREQGPDFWLLVVHLKAMPAGFEQRERQWQSLVAIAEGSIAEVSGAEVSGAEATIGQGDRDLVILGDFNSTGPVGSSPADEHGRLDQALAPAGLRRLSSATGCTAYYDGRRRDAWKQPSEIDLVWVRELHESLATDAVVHSGTHCAAWACRDFRSSDAYPVRDYRDVSDHCPVVVDLARADDD